MTIRELCTVIGSALHVPDVQRWAAPLVRAGLWPRAGAEADAGAIEYVPAYFRACCEMARAGGTNGYKFAGYHLASELDRIIPHGMSKDEWITRLEALQQLIWPTDLKSLEKQDRERIADWFAAEFPQCMKLIPKRRCARFAEGVVELTEERNGIPGLPA